MINAYMYITYVEYHKFQLIYAHDLKIKIKA